MNRLVLIRALTLAATAILVWAGVVGAQTPATTATTMEASTQEPAAERPRKPQRRPGPSAKVTVVPSTSKVAPQVVTVVHRLSGIKMLRLLVRQAGENGVIETIDPETITRDAHANIIAGLTLDDGRTVTARLPQAAAEIEFNAFQGLLFNDQRVIGTTFPFFTPRTDPDLTVITSDGKKLRARLIGLDGETGLSVLQLPDPLPISPARAVSQDLVAGQSIQIFAPEPAPPEGPATALNTFVTLGKFNATISQSIRDNLGTLEKLTVRTDRLSPDIVGGVAFDQLGNTVGIVESIEGNDARLLSANVVRAATQRVLERRASVPRPVLGVRGESVEFAGRAEFLAHGWRDDQLTELRKTPVGILLTSVMPKTPAASAKLRPGDIIVRVNQHEVKSNDDFSRLLGEAGSGEQVEFTIKRPDTASPLSVPVMLGGSFAPQFEWHFELSAKTPRLFGLQELGIQTMALTTRAASQLGAQNGLIVIAVQPGSAAAKSGIREGDVVESIDGRRIGMTWTFSRKFTGQRKHQFSIVRDREKKQITVDTN